MQLVIPETTAVKEIIRVVFSPRHILLFQLLPLRRALLRRQIRIAVADVLELIHRHTERHKCDRIHQMCKAEFICIFSEKCLRIRIGELLHRHGVNLRNVGRL